MLVTFPPNAPTFGTDDWHTLIMRKYMQKVSKIFKALLAIPTGTFFCFAGGGNFFHSGLYVGFNSLFHLYLFAYLLDRFLVSEAFAFFGNPLWNILLFFHQVAVVPFLLFSFGKSDQWFRLYPHLLFFYFNRVSLQPNRIVRFRCFWKLNTLPLQRQPCIQERCYFHYINKNIIISFPSETSYNINPSIITKALNGLLNSLTRYLLLVPMLPPLSTLLLSKIITFFLPALSLRLWCSNCLFWAFVLCGW